MIAVAAAQHAVDVLLNQYRAGTVVYTSVVTEQTTLLSDQQAWRWRCSRVAWWQA